MVKPSRRAGESGQALVELAVSMVALMCVFMAVLFVSAMGLENIQNALSARQSVDENLASNPDSHAGVSISRWDTGNDQMFLTSDDEPVSGLDGSSTLYAGELAMDKTAVGDISTLASFELKDLKSCSAVESDYVDSVNSQFSASYLFVYAAGLASAQQSNDDPLGSRKLGDSLKSAFTFITNGGRLSLSDTAYMPYLENPK